ncbi:unnamed protein product [Didymodactylos carnosus]|uniref:Uncharacterized protein n=1 Tax=Didymodactylos carnosus TaxID=1234261 RepID=A0A8S2LTR5_9BILA|nr:unnamed protein product [Didymodactylos carnosus]CAF3923758.1 unnamed protein product [Didymodactylos carnosus]
MNKIILGLIAVYVLLIFKTNGEEFQGQHEYAVQKRATTLNNTETVISPVRSLQPVIGDIPTFLNFVINDLGGNVKNSMNNIINAIDRLVIHHPPAIDSLLSGLLDASLLASCTQLLTGMNATITNVGTEVQNVVSTLKSPIKSYIKNIIDNVNNILKSATVSELISKLRELLASITQSMGSLVPIVANLETAFTDILGNDFSGRLSSLIGVLRTVIEGKSLTLADKYIIGNLGTLLGNVDSIFAMNVKLLSDVERDLSYLQVIITRITLTLQALASIALDKNIQSAN